MNDTYTKSVNEASTAESTITILLSVLDLDLPPWYIPGMTSSEMHTRAGTPPSQTMTPWTVVDTERTLLYVAFLQSVNKVLIFRVGNHSRTTRKSFQHHRCRVWCQDCSVQGFRLRRRRHRRWFADLCLLLAAHFDPLVSSSCRCPSQRCKGWHGYFDHVHRWCRWVGYILQCCGC